MENLTLEQLLEQHAAAKKRMTLGIVFNAAALGICYIGGFVSAYSVITMWALVIGWLLILSSFPLFGVGIPFLITGIIRRVKLNNRINAARAEAKAFEAMSSTAAPVVEVAPEDVAVAAPIAEDLEKN